VFEIGDWKKKKERKIQKFMLNNHKYKRRHRSTLGGVQENRQINDILFNHVSEDVAGSPDGENARPWLIGKAIFAFFFRPENRFSTTENARPPTRRWNVQTRATMVRQEEFIIPGFLSLARSDYPTHHSHLLLLVETQLAEHLVTLFHH